MTISTGVPSSWNLPLFWATVDGSQAGNLTNVLPAILIGQMGSTSSSTPPTVGAGVLTGIGGGTLTLASTPYGAGIQAGSYRAICIATGTGTATFEVVRPDGTVDGIAAAGTAYVGEVNFTIACSGANYAIGATWAIPVTLPPTGAGGTASIGVAVPVGSPSLGTSLFGNGSMLDRMVQEFYKVNTTQELWALPVADPSGGMPAVGTIVVSAAPTASGTLSIYIAGQLVPVAVFSTDSMSAVASNLGAEINATLELPVTAVVTTNSVALTCKWKGLTGNDITIIPNYLGQNGGEAYPIGLALTIAPMATGSGEPDFSTAISNIQAKEFDYVALPYTDTGSMQAWATEYGFGSSGRWNFTRQLYGFCVGAVRNDYADALTWGMSQNAPVLSTMVIEPQAPTPVWEWTAAYCGLAALAFTDDPARPLQTLEMLGCLPAQLQYRFSQVELNNLTNNGLAIQGVAPDGNPMILREQTQYQFNSYGQGDTAFGLLTVLATLQYLLRAMKSAITSKYPRVKLIPDGTKIGPGQAAVTPTDIKAELISEFNDAQYNGLVADYSDFANNLIVEISNDNPNVIQVLWPPQLAGQLRQFDVLAQFRLLFPPVSAA